MAIDVLQDKIRKQKCPVVVDFTVLPEHIPPHLRDDAAPEAAYGRFCRELLTGLKGKVPALRFSLGAFALLGEAGIWELTGILTAARESGFYIFLDGPELHSPWAAKNAAEWLLGPESRFPLDGLILSPYLGSDTIRPFLQPCKERGKDLFPVVRSANKSAPELQDLLTGSRLVHTAAADLVSRYGGDMIGKYGYSQVGMLVGATTSSCVRPLRTKYKNTFFLLDGYDYPGGNGKNCAPAFDKLGHGAIVCAGGSIAGAWLTAESDGRDFVEQALETLERMKRNLTRYTTIL